MARSLQELLDAKEGGLGPELLERLPTPWRFRGSAARDYELSDEALVAALQAAMLLGQPLILAGEPGVGKTTLAAALAHRLELYFHDPVQVKSTASGLDLFYAFDEVARFRDASSPPPAAAEGSSGATKGLKDYVRLTSLGRAILWSAGPDALVTLGSVPADEILGRASRDTVLRLGDLFPNAFRHEEEDGAGGFVERRVDSSRRSVALIDELDKAPKDAPNDVLAELETMSFRIRELDLTVAARHSAWPILLVTSNSERSLPDAFLRRCVFHWIEFPTPERLYAIVAMRCGRDYGLEPGDTLLKSAVSVFISLRDKVENKKPATAELISFLVALREFGFQRGDTVDPEDPRVVQLFGTMMKTFVDLQVAAPKPAEAE